MKIFFSLFLSIFLLTSSFCQMITPSPSDISSIQTKQININKQGSIKEKQEVNKDSWPVAVVDKRMLFKMELNKNIEILMKNSPEAKGTEEYEARKRVYEERFVDEWVRNVLFAEEAVSKGLTVDDSEINDKIKKLLAESGINVQLSDKLKELNISEAEFRTQMRDAILTDKLIQYEISKRYTEEQLKAIYTAKPDFFRTSTTVRVSQIFKKYSGSETYSDKKKMKNELEDIRDKARKNPENFGELANRFSDDVLSKKNDGDLGWQDPFNLLPKPINTLIFKLKVNEISEVIETQYGYHIIKVTERKESKGNNFEEAKPLIIDSLFKSLGDTLFEEYKLKHKIYINTSGINPEKIKN